MITELELLSSTSDSIYSQSKTSNNNVVRLCRDRPSPNVDKSPVNVVSSISTLEYVTMYMVRANTDATTSDNIPTMENFASASGLSLRCPMPSRPWAGRDVQLGYDASAKNCGRGGNRAKEDITRDWKGKIDGKRRRLTSKYDQYTNVCLEHMRPRIPFFNSLGGEPGITNLSYRRHHIADEGRFAELVKSKKSHPDNHASWGISSAGRDAGKREAGRMRQPCETPCDTL
nr:hypothetical protein CFP56_00255 [Quercus suber]